VGVGAEDRGRGGAAYRSSDDDDAASSCDQAAGEVVAQLVELEGQPGVGADGTPAVVDEVVVPWLAVRVSRWALETSPQFDRGCCTLM